MSGSTTTAPRDARAAVSDQRRLTRALTIIRQLYHNTDARQISSSFRKAQGELDSPSLTYGEVDAKSFMQILALTTDRKGRDTSRERKFVDLGCGAGLPCVCAQLAPQGFGDIVGIEIVDGLVNLAQTLQSRLLESYSSLSTSPSSFAPAVKVVKKDKTASEVVDLTPIVLQILEKQWSTNESTIKVDLLASELCKCIGHKAYKASIKKHKSFQKYLESLSQFGTLSADGKSMSMADSFRTAVLAAESAINQINDEHSSVTQIECTAEEEESDQLRLESSDLQLFGALKPIRYLHGSIFDIDWWNDCDVAYAASLLFSEDMMEQLTQCVLRMPKGSWFVTLRPLPLNETDALRVTLVHDSFFKMSWQMARVYAYQIQQ